MTIVLSDFKNQIKDVVRPNRFRVEFYVNSSVWRTLADTDSASVSDAQRISSDTYKLQFVVKAASLPQRTIGQVEYKRYGLTAKYIGDPTFEDIDITFINDYEMLGRRFIDGWMEQVVSFEGNKRLVSQNTAKGSSMVLYQLGRNGEPLRGYEFFDIWPKTVAQTDLNMESNDQVSDFAVTFAYSYWKAVS